MRKFIVEKPTEENRVEITIKGLGYITIERIHNDTGTIFSVYKETKDIPETVEYITSFMLNDEDFETKKKRT